LRGTEPRRRRRAPSALAVPARLLPLSPKRNSPPLAHLVHDAGRLRALAGRRGARDHHAQRARGRRGGLCDRGLGLSATHDRPRAQRGRAGRARAALLGGRLVLLSREHSGDWLFEGERGDWSEARARGIVGEMGWWRETGLEREERRAEGFAGPPLPLSLLDTKRKPLPRP
jgi:hypothetical protein